MLNLRICDRHSKNSCCMTVDKLKAAPLPTETSRFFSIVEGHSADSFGICKPLSRFRREQIQDTVSFRSARFQSRAGAASKLEP